MYPMLPKMFRVLVLVVYGSSDNVELGKKNQKDLFGEEKNTICDFSRSYQMS